MTTDQTRTSGSQPTDRLRHRDVAAIAVPIIFSNATVPLVGYVDTVVIGQQVGAAHLIGGVALAAVMFNNIYWIFGFLRMGTTGLTAQATGAGNRAEITANLLRAVAVALCVGGLLIASQAALLGLFLWLMGGSGDVNSAVRTYFDIRIWGAPAALANFALVGWFIGLGRANVAFVLQLILNLVNIGCALLFVLGWQWGVAGVGLAALLSDLVAMAAGIGFAWLELRRRGARLAEANVGDRSALWLMFNVNRDVILRNACLIFGFTFFASQGARGRRSGTCDQCLVAVDRTDICLHARWLCLCR